MIKASFCFTSQQLKAHGSTPTLTDAK